MKVKRLYTIGDSWTFGDELLNPGVQSWPVLLSQKLDCKLVNEASPGASNDWMFRKIIEWSCVQKDLNDDVVIVGWSVPDRYEEKFKFNIDYKKMKKYFYISELLYYRSVCYMVSLQEFLKSKNIKYLFFNPWYDILECELSLINQRHLESKVKSKSKKEYYIKNLTIGEIIKEIDTKFCIGPFVKKYEKEYNVSKIVPKHPNVEEHKTMAMFIEEKLIEVYGCQE